MQNKSFFFNKNKNKDFFIIIIIILSLIICSFFLFIKITSNNFFIIPSFEGVFFITPKDRGGVKVKNINKKSLHLNEQFTENIEVYDSTKLNYSIQFFVSSEYKEIISYLNNFINNYEKVYSREDFFVVAFTTDLGIEYFLLYKNFSTKDKAQEYCSKYVLQNNKCIVVKVSNF